MRPSKLTADCHFATVETRLGTNFRIFKFDRGYRAEAWEFNFHINADSLSDLKRQLAKH